MALIISSGLSTSNSYVTDAEASGYLCCAHHDVSTWAALDSAQRETRIILGAYLLNTVPLRGHKACIEQALVFPRWTGREEGYLNRPTDGYSEISDITAEGYEVPAIPDNVKIAQIELAFQVVHSGIFEAGILDFPERMVQAVNLGGSLSVVFASGSQGAQAVWSKARISSLDVVRLYLNQWIRNFGGGAV